MPLIGFADRLAYLRWLRGRGRLRLETDDEFASALGLSGAWVVKWKASASPPNNRDTAKAIDESRAVPRLTSAWLFDGEGEPPEPERWAEWNAARERPKRSAKLEAEPIAAPRKKDQQRRKGA